MAQKTGLFKTIFLNCLSSFFLIAISDNFNSDKVYIWCDNYTFGGHDSPPETFIIFFYSNYAAIIITLCHFPQHHLSTVDSEEKLGLSTDSILYYTMDSSVKRVPGIYLY